MIILKMTTFLRFCDNPQLNVNATDNNCDHKHDSHDVYLYKTFYYRESDLGNGDYSPILGEKSNTLGKRFIDIVHLYSDQTFTTREGTISWNDILFRNPGFNNVHANEVINITLFDRECASFVGGYISIDGFYKPGYPQRIELENHSLNIVNKDIFFAIHIEVIPNTNNRQVKLYKCKNH